MLHGQHSDRLLSADDGDAGEAVETLFARFGAIGKGGVRRRLGQVQDSAFLGDRSDQALAQPQAGDVHRFFAKAVRRGKLQRLVAQQIDGADLALHRLGDQVDHLVQLGLRRPALGHHIMKAGQNLPGGCGGGQRHGDALSDGEARCHAGRDAFPRLASISVALCFNR